MNELSLTLPLDDWEFMSAVLAAQAADYDVMQFVKTAKADSFNELAVRCRRLGNSILRALRGYQGKYVGPPPPQAGA